MTAPDLVTSGFDATEIAEAHFAAQATCEPWLAALEQSVAGARAAGLAAASLPPEDQRAYLAASRAELEALIDAARAFVSSVEEALQALPIPGHAGAATQSDPSVSP